MVAPIAPTLPSPYSLGGTPSFGGGVGGGMMAAYNPGAAVANASAAGAARDASMRQFITGLMAQQTQASNRIAQGFTQQGAARDKNLAAQEAATLKQYQGSNAFRQTQINNQFAQEQGQANQRLASSGMSAWAQPMVDQGIMNQRQQVQQANTNQFQQMMGGVKQNYDMARNSTQNQYGLGGLNYLGNANQQIAGLGMQGLGYLSSIPLPPYQLNGMGGGGQQQYGGGNGGMMPSTTQGGPMAGGPSGAHFGSPGNYLPDSTGGGFANALGITPGGSGGGFGTSSAFSYPGTYSTAGATGSEGAVYPQASNQQANDQTVAAWQGSEGSG